MKKILVPVNFTKASEIATTYAASLASVMAAELQLLHVYKESIPSTVGPDPWSITKSEIYQKKQERLNREIQYLGKKYQLPVSGELLTGSRSDAISQLSEEQNVSLLVMCLKDEDKMIPGSTVFKVLRKTEKPVLVVKEQSVYRPIKHVVFAVDFSKKINRRAVDPLIEIVKAYDAELHVIHVEEKGADWKPAEVDPKLEIGAALGKITYRYDKLENNDIETAIRDYIESHPADLLVMLSRHHSLVSRIFGMVHTTAMAYLSKIPMLILK